MSASWEVRAGGELGPGGEVVAGLADVRVVAGAGGLVTTRGNGFRLSGSFTQMDEVHHFSLGLCRSSLPLRQETEAQPEMETR